MERWAKTLNQKKEIAKMNAVAVQQAAAAAKAASTADIAFAVLERKESSVNLPFPETAQEQVEHPQVNFFFCNIQIYPEIFSKFTYNKKIFIQVEFSCILRRRE